MEDGFDLASITVRSELGPRFCPASLQGPQTSFIGALVDFDPDEGEDADGDDEALSVGEGSVTVPFLSLPSAPLNPWPSWRSFCDVAEALLKPRSVKSLRCTGWRRRSLYNSHSAVCCCCRRSSSLLAEESSDVNKAVCASSANLLHPPPYNSLRLSRKKRRLSQVADASAPHCKTLPSREPDTCRESAAWEAQPQRSGDEDPRLDLRERFLFAASAIKAWGLKGRLTTSLELTLHLLETFLADPAFFPAARVEGEAASRGLAHLHHPCATATFNEELLRLSYAMVIIRFVNLTVEHAQTGTFAASVATVARRVGIDQELVQIRHGATHHGLPSEGILRDAALSCFEHLLLNYWKPQMRLALDRLYIQRPDKAERSVYDATVFEKEEPLSGGDAAGDRDICVLPDHRSSSVAALADLTVQCSFPQFDLLEASRCVQAEVRLERLVSTDKERLALLQQLFVERHCGPVAVIRGKRGVVVRRLFELSRPRHGTAFLERVNRRLLTDAQVLFREWERQWEELRADWSTAASSLQSSLQPSSNGFGSKGTEEDAMRQAAIGDTCAWAEDALSRHRRSAHLLQRIMDRDGDEHVLLSWVAECLCCLYSPQHHPDLVLLTMRLLPSATVSFSTSLLKKLVAFGSPIESATAAVQTCCKSRHHASQSPVAVGEEKVLLRLCQWLRIIASKGGASNFDLSLAWKGSGHCLDCRGATVALEDILNCMVCFCCQVLEPARRNAREWLSLLSGSLTLSSAAVLQESASCTSFSEKVPSDNWLDALALDFHCSTALLRRASQQVRRQREEEEGEEEDEETRHHHGDHNHHENEHYPSSEGSRYWRISSRPSAEEQDGTTQQSSAFRDSWFLDVSSLSPLGVFGDATAALVFLQQPRTAAPGAGGERLKPPDLPCMLLLAEQRLATAFQIVGEEICTDSLMACVFHCSEVMKLMGLLALRFPAFQETPVRRASRSKAASVSFRDLTRQLLLKQKLLMRFGINSESRKPVAFTKKISPLDRFDARSIRSLLSLFLIPHTASMKKLTGGTGDRDPASPYLSKLRKKAHLGAVGLHSFQSFFSAVSNAVLFLENAASDRIQIHAPANPAEPLREPCVLSELLARLLHHCSAAFSAFAAVTLVSRRMQFLLPRTSAAEHAALCATVASSIMSSPRSACAKFLNKKRDCDLTLVRKSQQVLKSIEGDIKRAEDALALFKKKLAARICPPTKQTLETVLTPTLLDFPGVCQLLSPAEAVDAQMKRAVTKGARPAKPFTSKCRGIRLARGEKCSLPLHACCSESKADSAEESFPQDTSKVPQEACSYAAGGTNVSDTAAAKGAATLRCKLSAASTNVSQRESMLTKRCLRRGRPTSSPEEPTSIKEPEQLYVRGAGGGVCRCYGDENETSENEWVSPFVL